MKFSAGYQADEAWVDALVARRDALCDVYFAFGSMPSGRKAVTSEERQLEDLGRIADAGIPLHILFNANCYGARAQARSFFAEIGDTIERFAADGALTGVTTTSPLLAKFVKDNFPQLETRASVNMEIGTVEGMDYLADVFDGYYLKRELNRDLAAVRRIKEWCDAHGKRLYLLANYGTNELDRAGGSGELRGTLHGDEACHAHQRASRANTGVLCDRLASGRHHVTARAEPFSAVRAKGAKMITETAEGVILNVRAAPRSSRAGLDGTVGDAVKVRVRSAPVDGKANKELIETLADAFGVAKSAVSFVSGETSKTKRVLLRGVTKEAILSRL